VLFRLPGRSGGQVAGCRGPRASAQRCRRCKALRLCGHRCSTSGCRAHGERGWHGEASATGHGRPVVAAGQLASGLGRLPPASGGRGPGGWRGWMIAVTSSRSPWRAAAVTASRSRHPTPSTGPGAGPASASSWSTSAARSSCGGAGGPSRGSVVRGRGLGVVRSPGAARPAGRPVRCGPGLRSMSGRRGVAVRAAMSGRARWWLGRERGWLGHVGAGDDELLVAASADQFPAAVDGGELVEDEGDVLTLAAPARHVRRRPAHADPARATLLSCHGSSPRPTRHARWVGSVVFLLAALGSEARRTTPDDIKETPPAASPPTTRRHALAAGH
jgi:hypothetical protein